MSYISMIFALRKGHIFFGLLHRISLLLLYIFKFEMFVKRCGKKTKDLRNKHGYLMITYLTLIYISFVITF